MIHDYYRRFLRLLFSEIEAIERTSFASISFNHGERNTIIVPLLIIIIIVPRLRYAKHTQRCFDDHR